MSVEINELNRVARDLRDEYGVESAIVRSAGNEPIGVGLTLLEVDIPLIAFPDPITESDAEFFGVRNGNVLFC